MDIKVSLETSVEDLVERFPDAVGFLSRHGVRCIRCGELLWCTLGEMLREDGIDDPQLLVDELIEYIRKKRERAGASE